ncbi:MAG: hypothetical protein WKG07_23075 [Hymenobacter sp.]
MTAPCTCTTHYAAAGASSHPPHRLPHRFDGLPAGPRPAADYLAPPLLAPANALPALRRERGAARSAAAGGKIPGALAAAKGALQGYSCTGAASIAAALGHGDEALRYLNGLWDAGFLTP